MHSLEDVTLQLHSLHSSLEAVHNSLMYKKTRFAEELKLTNG